MRTLSSAVLMCLVAAVAGRADVTLRYTYEIKPGPMIPAEALKAMNAQMEQQMSQMQVGVQLKGNRALSTVGGMMFISDFDGAMITLLNTAKRQYATVQSTEYLRIVSGQTEKTLTPEARRAMAQMKMELQPGSPGPPVVIRGMKAEERQMVLTMNPPPPATGVVRCVISLWVPAAEEVDRNPALRELKQYSERSYAGTDAGGMMKKMLGHAPGLESGLASLTEAFKNTPALLRMRMAIHVPGFAAMMAKMAAAKGDPPPPAVDENAPMMEMFMNLSEFSTAEISDSIFEIPRDHTVISLEEMLRNQAPPAAPPKPQ